MTSPYRDMANRPNLNTGANGTTRGLEASMARAQSFVPPLPKTIDITKNVKNYNEWRNGLVISGDSRGYVTAMPWITHEIGSNSALGTVSNPIFLPSSYDDMLIRGGALQSANHALEDVYRISRQAIVSGKGIVWTAREVGLQLTNPRPETRLFNPATMLLNVATQHLGIRFPRHGVNPFRVGSGNGMLDPSGYNTYSTVKDYSKDGVNLAISPVVPIRRKYSKLEDMTLDAFGVSRNDPDFGEKLGHLSAMRGATKLPGAGAEGIMRLSAKPDEAGGAAPFWPVSYLGKVHSLYGFDVLGSAQINRVVNTQYDFDGNPINKSPSSAPPAPTLKNITDVGGSDLLKRYTTLSYGDLGLPSKTYFGNDVSKKDTLTGPTDNYKSMGLIRSNRKPSPTKKAMVNRAFPDEGNPNGTADIINATGFKTELSEDGITEWLSSNSGLDDFIPLLFYDVYGKTALLFRSTISGLQDSISPTWNEYSYVGNPQTFYTYKGTTREVSFSFTVYTVSETELEPNWIKLSRLAGMCYPSYKLDADKPGKMISPFIKLTLGDIYYRVPGFISSFTLTVDDNSPWEIGIEQDLLKAPHVVKCDVGFTYIGSYSPAQTTQHFAREGGKNISWPTTIRNGLS